MTSEVLQRYENARKIHQGSGHNTMVKNDFVIPNWISDSHCFWYQRATKKGKEFRLVDPRIASNELAFDHRVLASALGKAINKTIDYQNLPLKHLVLTLSPVQVKFIAFDKHWKFNAEDTVCSIISDIFEGYQSPFGDNVEFIPQYLPEKEQELVSPDGKKAAFVFDYNLWIRDLATCEEQPLTKDGTSDYGYSSKRCLGIDTAVQALWSPDSTRLYTVRRDVREVLLCTSMNYAPQDGSLYPQSVQTKHPFPGCEHMDTYQLVVIDVNTKQLQVADYPAIPLTRSGTMAAGFFRAKLGWWSSDSRYAFFVDIARGAKSVRVNKWDLQTGIISVLFEEISDTSVKLNHEMMDPLQILPLPESDELIWFSERNGWAHLYLYDMNTGQLKRQITGEQASLNGGDSVPMLVRKLLQFDATRRELILQTAARDHNISPYYCDICKVNIDSGVLTTLASGDFEYRVYQYLDDGIIPSLFRGDASCGANGISPCGQYIVATRSRVNTVPETLLLDRGGKLILELEKADVSDLPADWVWPEPIKLKGADNETDIYGVVFRPPGFSPSKSYPIVEFANSGRFTSGFPQGSFTNSQQSGFVYYLASAIAALGFIVVNIDGRGTPLRGKAFHDYHYGDFSKTSDFDDRIAAIRHLAKRYPYMDLERVGITSPEQSTNAVYALLKHSDFYKVAVQHCLADPRFVMSLSETYDGTIDNAIIRKACYPEDYVESFSGKLLLIVGMLSTIATSSSFHLVEALQKANKDFDMLCLPNLHQEMSSYTTRREWDYLVKNLQGVVPPNGFEMKTAYDILHEESEELLAVLNKKE